MGVGAVKNYFEILVNVTMWTECMDVGRCMYVGMFNLDFNV